MGKRQSLQSDIFFLNNGYSIISANAEFDLIFFRDWILSAINHLINSKDEVAFPQWIDLISNYSLHPFLHHYFSQKQNRLFSPSQVELFYNSIIYKSVEEQIGPFAISSEENSDYPQIYWRISRPHSPTDVGPLHKDSWFWNVNPDWDISTRSTRYKVWVPLQCEPLRNGLFVLPGSHLNDSFIYETTKIADKFKPLIINPPSQEDLLLLTPDLGSYIIFHDNLLHGGANNLGTYPRISFEFTCITNHE